MPPLNPHLPRQAEIMERVEEAADIFTLRLRISDPEAHNKYDLQPGQFNMLYLFGGGEVPISIVSDPEHDDLLYHTIRAVGRVTRGLAKLSIGDKIGIRGPYGRGWPMDQLRGKDTLIITGGLGCAPSVSVVEYIMKRREHYGRLTIMQGVKHYNDLFWRQRYEQWARALDTQVLLTADQGGPIWPWHVGPVTTLFDAIGIDPERTMALICGPGGMMRAVLKQLQRLCLPEANIWLSMERNMQCAIGQCGHCQLGPTFVCRNGPVFSLPEIGSVLGVKGI